ncbi:hypothetical protein Mal64_25850 [Pseudobythopirellula maris]|uniref:Uncharacterized protein n=1 Tax=Pseudobythopirellula maris TaxID=2527991 RepID=A0A5C5ZSB4_9BACT|nr:hypothetical protein [Pseudobythopirellula maris]TWT89093.1 hypothetical protein Mal64_25850 [Pseudobythopirellula maris]
MVYHHCHAVNHADPKQTPKDSPTTPDSEPNAFPTDGPEATTPAKRPVGVAILMVLHLIGGVLLLGMTIFLAVLDPEAEFWQMMQQVGLPQVLLVAGMLLLSLLAIGSGVGMWLGTRWGWWLTAFYYAYSVARNASALLSPGMIAEEFGEPEEGLTKHYLKFGVRVVIHALLLAYLFKQNVLAYFGMSGVSKGKSFGALALAVVALFALFFLLGA